MIFCFCVYVHTWNLKVYCRTCVFFTSVIKTWVQTSNMLTGKSTGSVDSAAFRNALFLVSLICFLQPFFGADRELHKREHEDRDGSIAAERCTQPDSSHVGNGHQPSFSDCWTDTQADWRWDTGKSSKNTLTLMLSNTLVSIKNIPLNDLFMSFSFIHTHNNTERIHPMLHKPNYSTFSCLRKVTDNWPKTIVMLYKFQSLLWLIWLRFVWVFIWRSLRRRWWKLVMF